MEDNEENGLADREKEEGKEEVFESNASRRLKALGIDTDNAEHPPEDPEEQTPKKKKFFENLWYHYKIPILISIGFAIIFAVGITQMVRRKNPDIYVLYAGPAVFDNTLTSDAEDAFSALVTEDSNNDGKYVAQLTAFCYVSDEKAAEAIAEAEKNNVQSSVVDYAKSQENRDSLTAFSEYAFYGDAVVYLVDPFLFGRVESQNGFMTLEEALGYKPEGAIDDYGIPAKLLPFFSETPAFSTLPDDTVLAIRRLQTSTILTGTKKGEKAHERHLAFARDLFAYVPEETAKTAD